MGVTAEDEIEVRQEPLRDDLRRVHETDRRDVLTCPIDVVRGVPGEMGVVDTRDSDPSLRRVDGVGGVG